MKRSREELLQLLIERIRCVMKGMHIGHPFGELTLGRPQVGILFSLARSKGGLSVKELAAKFSVTSGAITQLTDSLVEKNLVQREEDQKDRRVIKITLTKKAENKFKEFKKNYFRSVKPLFDNLDDDELSQLLSLLQKVVTERAEKSKKV